MELPRHRTKVWPRLEKFKTLEAVVVISNGRTQNFFLFVVSIVCSALQNLIFFSKCSLVELQKQKKNIHFHLQNYNILVEYFFLEKKSPYLKEHYCGNCHQYEIFLGILSIIFSIQTRLKKTRQKKQY